MYPIASYLVPVGGVSLVTFSSIPQTFSHLHLRVSAQCSYADAGGPGQIFMNFNSDTGANYTRHEMLGNGSTIASGGFGAGSYNYVSVQRFLYTSAANNGFGASLVDILDYTMTNKNKTTKNIGGFDNNGSGETGLATSVWLSTSAISRIDLTPIAGNTFKQNSRFDLYGISNSTMAGS
jgi:hypothetical protein